MEDVVDAYSSKQFAAALAETAKRLLAKPEVVPVERPIGFLLGGQSGAGKTALHCICGERLGGNAIVINGDEFRRSHPNFQKIQEQYGMDAPAHTAKWSGQMTEALIDAFSKQGYNLIVEGTLRTSEVPHATARLLRSRGYAVSLAIMAVKPEISLISCQIRYEMMRLAGTTPRATDPEHHNKIVHDIVDNLAVLDESGEFDEVLIYNRAGVRLYPTEDQGNVSASDALCEVIFGSWTEEEEQHRDSLRAQLEMLRVRESDTAS